MEDKDLKWIFEIKDRALLFLEKLRGEKRKGFYHYSLSGDYFGENIKWGLGNAVFFLKIIYTLGLEDKFKNETEETIDFIKSFQKKNGVFSDGFLRMVAFPFNLKELISLGGNNFSLSKVERAETRQAFSSLRLFNEKAKYFYNKLPKTKSETEKYLNDLDWSLPWSAGSHFSHLLFFLNQSNFENKKELIEYAIFWVNELQNENDGFWYKGNPEIAQKINGAMKIITGLNAVGELKIKYAEKIIDACLEAKNDKHACDNFNIVYVLRYCLEAVGSGFKKEEIKNFMKDRLDIYKEYYHSEVGGFSFKKNKADRFYYGALITMGKNEPDIHGTAMFLWGISLIAQVLEINNELGFKETLA